MPNWVTARLTIKGPNSEEVMKKLLVEDEEASDGVRFDFNKIIPMPEALNVISGSVSDDCMRLFLKSLDVDHPDFKEYLYAFVNGRNKKYISLTDDEERKLEKRYFGYSDEDVKFNSREDMNAYGKLNLDNIRLYGYQNWYDWSCANWGTKWNACHTSYSAEEPSVVYFDTAWSEIRQLIFELSKQYPENTFEYEYAEEQIGIQTGICEFKAGKIIRDLEFPDYSKEAYETAFELWGEGIKENYKFNPEKNTYEFIEVDSDEEM